MEMLVMMLVNEAENEYLRIKEQSIKQIVKIALEKAKENEKITSTEYQSALDILERYKLG